MCATKDEKRLKSTAISVTPTAKTTEGNGSIVLYCMMRPYTEGRLDRYSIDIPRELSEIRTQPRLS